MEEEGGDLRQRGWTEGGRGCVKEGMKGRRREKKKGEMVRRKGRKNEGKREGLPFPVFACVPLIQ